MKIVWKLMMVIVLIAFAISCLKVEPTPQFTKSDATFSATASVSSVTPTATDSVSGILTFNWTDPKYSVGLSQSKFSVVVGATGKNFASFAQKDFSGVLTGVLLGKEINAMALKFGGVIGQQITLDVKVVASQVNNNEQLSSSVLQVAVTPYGDLGLKGAPLTVVCTAATSAQVGSIISWSNAFNGYTGVKKYELQYAKGGTSFASPTVSTVTSYSQTFTQLDLNKIALGYGVAGGSSGTVDFRIKASNESGTVEYSNTVTITITTYVANNSIGLVGDATAGGWNTDTDMYRPDPVNKPANWTVTLYLTGGKAAKFRADDAWATNWGGSTFPTGASTQNGPNIPVANSGYYQVDFNAGSGAYAFTSLTPTTYAAMIIVGDFNGWSTSSGAVNMTADASGHIWKSTLSIASALPYGLKFVGDQNTWIGSNSSSYHSGYASTSGGNINPPVGNYFVYFNDVSGEFFFGSTGDNAGAGTPYNQMGFVGDANPGGWNTDTFMIQDPTNPYKWSLKVIDANGKPIPLTAGGAKFRANAAWTTSWGGTTFPSGVGTTQNGPNIPVTAGTPQITFNSATGEYTFTY
jgi:hypothetical protein